MKSFSSMFLLCVLFAYTNPLEGQNNKYLDSVLIEIYDADQSIRKETSRIMSSNNDSLIRDYVMRQKTIDSKNKQIVSSILDSIAWPKGLSEKANLGIFLVIDHGGKTFGNKYLALVKSEAEKGTIAMSLYVTLYDRLLMFDRKKQVYGTQTINLQKDGVNKLYLWPIEACDNLNQLREQVGLPTIESYLANFNNIIWDENFRIEDVPSYYFP